MRITVGIPSRGRPLDLVASAVSLFRIASGNHEVKAIVWVDEDDVSTGVRALDMADKYPGQFQIEVHERTLGLGQIHNRMAAMTPPDAAFMLWSDRVMAITPGWDHELAMACLRYPRRVLWMDSVHLAGAGQFILPPAWRATQGSPTPGIFPYWFEDSAVEEIDHFVHGPVRVALQSKCAGSRGAKTTRMRDLPFWINVFAKTRPQRVAKAVEMREAWGMPPRDMSAEIAFFEARDRDFLARAPMLEAEYGAPGEPDESYLAAKAAAEAFL